jgi:hypothetical protein
MPDADPADTDRDGVWDFVDNCPAIANPDQTDADHNDVGDLCEGCVTLPLRSIDDDDDDNIVDDEDNCFGIGTAQPDDDQDEVGNACDGRVTRDARFCVWTFRPAEAAENPAVWAQEWKLGSGWSIASSALVHVGLGQRTYADLTRQLAGPGGVAIDTFMRLDGYSGAVLFGVELELPSPHPTFACQISQPASGMGAVELVRGGQIAQSIAIPVPLPQQASTYMRLSVTENSAAQELTVRCMVVSDLGTAPLSLTLPGSAQASKPRLFNSNGTVSFEHVALYKLGI